MLLLFAEIVIAALRVGTTTGKCPQDLQYAQAAAICHTSTQSPLNHLCRYMSRYYNQVFQLSCTCMHCPRNGLVHRTHLVYRVPPLGRHGVASCILFQSSSASQSQLLAGQHDTVQCFCRGMGRQAVLLVLGISGFWGGGVLVSALLAFPAGWGVQGLWLGLNCGTSIVGECLNDPMIAS